MIGFRCFKSKASLTEASSGCFIQVISGNNVIKWVPEHLKLIMIQKIYHYQSLHPSHVAMSQQDFLTSEHLFQFQITQYCNGPQPNTFFQIKSSEQFSSTNTHILNSHATKSENHPHLHRNNIGSIEGSVIFCLFLAPRVSSYFKFKERFQDMERRKKNELFSNLIESNVRDNWKMDNDGFTFTGVNYL